MGELRTYDRLKKSMDRMEELKRQGTLPWHDGLLWFFADGYISVWSRGQRYATVTPQKREPIVTPLSEIRGSNTERRQQQSIALRYLPSRENPLERCVLGVEFSIPKRMVPEKPETDLLVVDRAGKIIYLTEYKCNYDAATNEKASLRKHYRDMKYIADHYSGEVRDDCAVCYRLYTQAEETPDFSDYQIRIAFLFTNMNRCVSTKKVDRLNTLLDEVGREDPQVLIWDFPAPASVDFSQPPQPIAGAGRFRFAARPGGGAPCI